MNKIFNLTSTFKTLTEDDGSVHICGMASTSDFDRAGDSIDATAWTKGGLANFEKNPIILFNHDYNHPIGRATGLKVTENGLELKAKISKSAKVPSGSVSDLVKDGVLGAFSVGFRVKDADYLTETDGLKIKDAELFEVSVVSVPCNQAATFSLAKSFDSMDEYEDFKKNFINNGVDLAGQTLAKDEDSLVASTPERGGDAQKEIKMSEENTTPEIDLQAFAKQVAEETAAKIAMKQAEKEAAAEKAAQEAEAKAQAEAEAKSKQVEANQAAIKVGIESGADRLMADVEAKLAEKDAKIEDVIASFQTELQEKNEELNKMRESKRVFADRSDRGDLSKWGKDFMYGHLLGVMTGKGWNTQYSQNLMEKAGIDYATDASGISQEVSTRIEKEIMLELRLAQAFRELTINSQTQVLPIQTDAGPAAWGSNTDTSGNLENRPEVTNAQYNAKQVILKATRLISTTFMDNNIDEEVLVNLMPMLVESVARAHARAVDNAVINGTSGGAEGFNGLEALAAANAFATDVPAGGGGAVTASDFLDARKLMGKYGMMPEDLVYVVSQKRYYDLIADAGFADITDVGSDVATKITGSVGAIYGTPVVVSDQLEAEGASATVGYAVNVRNHVIPRLRGVSVEQDYEVLNQRRVIVASQSLGFNQLVGNNGTTDVSVVKVIQAAS
jgi:HK97 family phage prohead protease